MEHWIHTYRVKNNGSICFRPAVPNLAPTFVLRLCLLLQVACLTLPASYGQKGRVVELFIHSQALEGNLLGDSPDREVLVYLPPSYDTAHERRYPVVYALHGNAANGSLNLKAYYGSPVLETIDPLIGEGKVREIIVVQPNSENRYGGSQYANSTVSGNWADFIVLDLVAYIDRNYRTLAKPESRGLTGHSMGGRGALYLSLKYPRTFSVVCATSPGQMAFQRTEIGDDESWRKILTATGPSFSSQREIRKLLGYSVAFSPNANKPPFYADFPKALIGNSLAVNEDVMKRWADFDPVQMIVKYAAPYRDLRVLYIDCGTSDRLIDNNRLFSNILTRENIPHVFDEYDGGHSDKKGERFATKVLPMFSKYLIFE